MCSPPHTYSEVVIESLTVLMDGYICPVVTMSTLVVWLWLVPPPAPHLWTGLDHPRYAVRSACARAIGRDPSQDWFVLRGLYIGSPESREQCQAILWSSTRFKKCRWCQRGVCTFQYNADCVCENCGRNHDVSVNHHLPPTENQFGKTGTTCHKCRGIGWRVRPPGLAYWNG